MTTMTKAIGSETSRHTARSIKLLAFPIVLQLMVVQRSTNSALHHSRFKWKYHDVQMAHIRFGGLVHQVQIEVGSLCQSPVHFQIFADLVKFQFLGLISLYQ
jgi:hypothetical protein